MKVLVILLVLLILFAALICYSACVAAGRADEGERKEWELKPNVDIPSENTNCVSIAVALLDDEQWEKDNEID